MFHCIFKEDHEYDAAVGRAIITASLSGKHRSRITTCLPRTRFTFTCKRLNYLNANKNIFTLPIDAKLRRLKIISAVRWICMVYLALKRLWDYKARSL